MQHRFRWTLPFLLVLLLFAPMRARAGYDVEIAGEGAYNYTGGCASTGTVAGRTVPLCSGTADGTFYIKSFVRVPGNSQVVTVDLIREVPNAAVPGSTTNTCWNVACTALTNLASSSTITFNAGQTITYNIHAVPCVNGEICKTTAGSSTAIEDLQSGSACGANQTCSDSDMICQVSWYGTSGTGCTNGSTTLGEAFSSMKLTVGP